MEDKHKHTLKNCSVTFTCFRRFSNKVGENFERFSNMIRGGSHCSFWAVFQQYLDLAGYCSLNSKILTAPTTTLIALSFFQPNLNT